MSILSLTFHTTENSSSDWDIYLEKELNQMVENLMEVEKFVISEVESEMIQDGKNTNILLIFESLEKRRDFIENELINIQDRIESKFGENVMIFKTYLNPKNSKL